MTCITCPARIYWKLAHAGHFIHNRPPIFFDLRNIHGQCEPCNISGSGRFRIYREVLEGLHGIEAVKALRREGTAFKRWKEPELVELTRKFREMTKAILAERYGPKPTEAPCPCCGCIPTACLCRCCENKHLLS